MGSPGDTGLLRRIRSAAPRARVIIYRGYVSMLDDGELGVEADAYIEKSDDEGALVAMIRAVGRQLAPALSSRAYAPCGSKGTCSTWAQPAGRPA